MLRSIVALVALTLSWTLAQPAPLSAQAGEQADSTRHLVVRGNTLWDLADFFYGNPFEWRRIWNANRDRVENPDLIFPGQRLLIPGVGGETIEVVVMPGGGEPTPEAAPDEGAGRPRFPERTLWYPDSTETAGFELERERIPAVQREVVYAAPFLVADGEPGAGGMGAVDGLAGAVQSRTARESARGSDRVFLSFEGVPPPPGTLLLTWRRLPTTIRALGTVAIPTGLVRVIGRDGERTVGLIERIFDRMLEGDRLGPVPDWVPLPGVQPEPVSNGATTTVAGFAMAGAEIQGPGDHLFIPLGRVDGVRLGDEYTIRMPGTGEHAEGRFQIVRVGERYATGRVIALRTPVFEVGVETTLERRLPGR